MGVSSLLHTFSNKNPVAAEPAVAGKEPSKDEIILNRYQSGPNLGAIFVQEKWIDSSLFKEGTDTGGSELGALESWGKHPDLNGLQSKWESHWSSFVSPQDWDLLCSKGITAVRLPIGFWSLPDAKKFTAKTPFEKYAKVYENSWKYVEKVLHDAADRGIGVLVDFHAVPGGANGDEHSGTSSGKAELWEHRKYRDHAIDAYAECVKLLDKHSNIIGLQLVNEAPWGQAKMKGFYLAAASRIRQVSNLGKRIPLIISDGWNYNEWVDIVKSFDKEARGNTGFVIDTHVYRTFSDDDKAKSAEDHINSAPQAVQPSDEVDAIVGEWSCCLDESSWQKSQIDRGQGEAQYGTNQLLNYTQLAGNFFWTFKFGQGNGGSWDWRNMSQQGVTVPRISPNRGNKSDALNQALNQHKQYWESQDSKKDWEHWRFEEGFSQGWDDAETFAQHDGSRIGRIAAWKDARSKQHAKERGASSQLWVYEQAIVQGIRARTGA